MNISALFHSTRPLIMGIINVTPDSFSGDGIMRGGDPGDFVQVAVAQARQMAEDGADLLDIGGVSTKPGAADVSPEEELRRVIPVIEAMRKAVNLPLSIDTFRAGVAEAALQAGAAIINDQWALQADPALGAFAARKNVPVILMHNRSNAESVTQDQKIGGQYDGADYKDFLEDMLRGMRAMAERALAAGIARENILLDPGIGFGKSVEQNLALINHADKFAALGYPIVLGPSRKSFIGRTLDLPADQRLEGTLAACVMGASRGARILRVHDVKEAARAVKMTGKILAA